MNGDLNCDSHYVVDLSSDVEILEFSRAANMPGAALNGAVVAEDVEDVGPEDEIIAAGPSREVSDAEPVADGTDADQIIRDDQRLKSLQSSLAEARALVQARSHALSEARNEVDRFERAVASRTKEIVDAADSRIDWIGSKFPWDAALSRALCDVFGISSFRPLQREALNACLSGRDVMAVLPTGHGKSLIYQLSAVVDGGVTVVVSPLIALMHDQMKSLKKINVPAFCLDSNSRKAESNAVYALLGGVTSEGRKMRKGEHKEPAEQKSPAERSITCWTPSSAPAAIVFVTPERIAKSKRFMAKLHVASEEKRLTRFVIDEAHCVSTMGHDFRNDYTQLGVFRRMFPKVPILCLTATASQKVSIDVSSSLGINPLVFQGPLDRPNLYYEVRRKNLGESVVEEIAKLIVSEFPKQSGIVYVLTRKEAYDVSIALQKDHGVAASCYHGDLDASERQDVYVAWCTGKVQCVVATIAFGLGIDKKDVRFIIHMQLPQSLEGYYQETGRAGRDGEPSKCILFYKSMDVVRLSAFVADKGAVRLPMVYASAKYAVGSSRVMAPRVTSIDGRRDPVLPAAPKKRPRGFDSTLGSSCRRAIIAASFGEAPPPRVDDHKLRDEEKQPFIDAGYGLASKCCDLCAQCSADDALVYVDVTDGAIHAIDVLRSFAKCRPKEHLTVNGLVTDWGNVGKKGTELRGEVPALPREFDKEARFELLIACILDDIICEYHHFGMYNMQGYIQVGNGAVSLERGHRVFIPLPPSHRLATRKKPKLE